jgi:TonB family protein
MPLILLAEDEAPTVDHVRSVLASQGWLVKTVDSRDQALRAASEFAPQLVLVNDRLAGVEDLVRTFSRRSGGPGIVLLSAEANGVESLPHDASDIDAVLKKPLKTEHLISTVRDRLAEGLEQKAATPVGTAKKIFTSQEIFGDLLDDILDPDHDVTQPEPADSSAEKKEPSEAAKIEATETTEEIDLEIEVPEPGSEAVEELEALDLPPAETEIPESTEVVVDEAPLDATQPVAEDEMADLEDMVREEVGAWAETVDSTDEQPVSLESVDGEAAPEISALEPEAPEPEEITPEDLGLKPVEDPFQQGVTIEQASDQAAVDSTIDLAVDLAEEIATEAEQARGVFTPMDEEEGEDGIDSRLEDTLAGVLADALTEVEDSSTEATEADEVSVDALLSSALGDLNLTSTRPKKASSAKDKEIVETTSETLDRMEVADEAEAADDDLELEVPEPLESEIDSDTSPPSSEAISKPPGQEFGDYTLEKRIGVGGMAEVWKARRKGVEGFQKRVAIKKILPQAAENEAFVEMFIDEAKLAAQLNHNNIIHIYDLGRLGEDYYIAMEYVDGKNLRQILTAGRRTGQPIPEEIALYITARLADALDYAHRSKDFNDADLGLVHRDVSPQNVLISLDGDIKLCDFGIAKAVSKMSTTQMGALKGKLQYMSPEQAWGKSIDHRSDIFSLGTLLFEMLTRERLFAGESEMSVLETVRECDVAERIIQSTEISAGVKGLLLKALAREPESRFETAGELQAGLEEILGNVSPAPGQKEVAAYMSSVLEEPSQSDSDSESVEEPEPAAKPSAADLADAEWVGLPSEVEVTAENEEERRKQAWLKNLLTKLLPVILVLAGLGGILGFALTREDTLATEPTTSGARAPTAEAASLVPSDNPPPAVPASVEDQPLENDAVPNQGAADQPTPPILAPERPPVQQASREGSPPTSTTPTEADLQTEVAANPGGLTEIPTTQAVDPDLEERVEQDLQRVQELIASSPFENDPAGSPATDSEPRLITFQRPDYIPAEGGDEAEGTVSVSLLVDESGQVIDSLLVSGLPQYPGLNESVLAAARSASFEPGVREGEPTQMWYELSVQYER